MRNILCKLPEKARPWLKKLIQKAFSAATHKKCLEQAQGIVAMYMSEKSGLSLMFAVPVDASASWRGVKLSPAISQELGALLKPLGCVTALCRGSSLGEVCEMPPLASLNAPGLA